MCIVLICFICLDWHVHINKWKHLNIHACKLYICPWFDNPWFCVFDFCLLFCGEALFPFGLIAGLPHLSSACLLSFSLLLFYDWRFWHFVRMLKKYSSALLIRRVLTEVCLDDPPSVHCSSADFMHLVFVWSAVCASGVNEGADPTAGVWAHGAPHCK